MRNSRGAAILPVGCSAYRPCDIFHKLPIGSFFSEFTPLRMATETTLRPGEIKDILLRETDAVISSISPAIAFFNP